jgi:preprotein translocase subunit SecF
MTMVELLPQQLNIDFVGKAKFCITLSLLVILLGLGSVIVHGGLNEGIDFSGGTLIQLRFSKPVDLGGVREALATIGFGKGIVQHYGDAHEVLIRVPQHAHEGQDVGKHVQQTLQERLADQTVEVRRVEVVGAQASSDLRRKALFALFYATLGTVAYISGRFEGKWFVALSLAVVLFAVTYGITQGLPGISPAVLIVIALVVATAFNLVLQLRFALAAIVAIYHDVLTTVSFLSLFNIEFDLQILAALLTITGYSLYDTIVVFDRIRENMRGRRREQFPTIVNDSINQTLSRTILTAGHTILVLLALYLLGGEVLHGFAFTLLVGMISGTYSTVFIASPILVYWHTLGIRFQDHPWLMSKLGSKRVSSRP